MNHPFSACITGVMLAVFTAPAFGAEEWVENSPYYEKETWYDVSEWFDDDGYKRTDTATKSGDYYDESVYDNNSYDGYDSYDNDDRASNGSAKSFGYDDRYAADNWYYDYWDDGYAYYDDTNDDGRYDFSYSLYDFDGDGFYDAYYSFADTDNDGLYEDVEVFTFGDPQDSDRQKSSRTQQTASGSSEARQVTGKVANTKKTSVRDSKHLVAMVKPDDGDANEVVIVDLGPAEKLSSMNIEKGTQLKASGPMARVGDKRVLVAQKASVDGQSKQIERNRQKMSGQIVDTRQFKAGGQQHTAAIVKTGKEKKVLVDLGPAESLDVDLQNGDQVEVQGAPAKVNDRVMLLADSLRHDGEKVSIDRRNSRKSKNASQEPSQTAKSDQQESQSRQGRTLSGEVVSMKRLDVRGTERQVAKIDSDRGELLIDLGPAEKFQRDLRKGDRVTATGMITQSPQGKQVMIVRTLKLGNDSSQVAGRESNERLADKSSVSGEIVSMQQATLRGEPRQLVTLKTDQGKRVIADLGAPDALDKSLKKGTQLTVHGAAVKAGDKVVLVAFEVESANGDATRVRRAQNESSSRK
ncbi:hypothetical protein Pla175_10940 [Pirellulimonas nuda]|uniref:Magnetosome protein MamS/MamX domain-containing protein n=1 Tax=Pirellulimonas nuda TaxID=2528009 RepID=A0A518D8D5_9BACT|nr:hypothetical protein [Pirellulimonas nuda]QDU87728.1 hypothetical protein Pla175_10940 [Pirellulimonas nuda]